MKLYMLRTVLLSNIRSFSLYTQQWYMSSRFADSLRAGSGWSKLSANLYDIYRCCVYSKKTPDDGQRNCPKHVEFHSKNISLILLVSCQQICMTYTIARCTVKNSRRWPEELSETCRVSFQE